MARATQSASPVAIDPVTPVPIGTRRGHSQPLELPELVQRVLFVATEMADFVKAGGLGDVAAALPRAVRGACDSRVLLPGYPEVLQRLPQLQRVGHVSARAGLPACTIGMAVQADGLPIYVLLSAELYEREGSPYVDGQGQEWKDNAVRFATLSHAAAEIAAGRAGLDWSPQLLHLNDWPVAMAAAYVRWDRTAVPTLLTIHNRLTRGCFRTRLHPCWACRPNTG